MLEMEKYINITFTESDQPIFPSLHKNFTCTVRSHAKPLLIMQFLGIDFFFLHNLSSQGITVWPKIMIS